MNTYKVKWRFREEEQDFVVTEITTNYVGSDEFRVQAVDEHGAFAEALQVFDAVLAQLRESGDIARDNQ